MSLSLNLVKGFSFGAKTITSLTSHKTLESSLDTAKWYFIFWLFIPLILNSDSKWAKNKAMLSLKYVGQRVLIVLVASALSSILNSLSARKQKWKTLLARQRMLSYIYHSQNRMLPSRYPTPAKTTKERKKKRSGRKNFVSGKFKYEEDREMRQLF